MSELAGRRALVTGAGGGIGRACAIRLAAAGAAVVAADRDGAALEALVSEIEGLASETESLGSKIEVEPVIVDLADLDAVDRLDLAVDIVVNNAGLQHVAPIEDFPPERFSYLLRVMLEAPFRIVRMALPHMYAQGWGRIVNISSVHGLVASPYKSAYTAAKHGLEGLSKVIALEGAEHGVTSNCVNPAYANTPLVTNQVDAQARTLGITADRVVDEVMLGPAAVKRLIEPDEIAELVAYLCGDAASAITGSSLRIDGGWTAR
ncbi:3-hydroxybutyrate dehydrogenase [Actinophytocola sp.]|uniref:3-hydroxybutyrate dehydrogenase n=1 Tax=Actinophytocola sp. TaxID=1872138 RepID=UPI002D60F3ED|nr:3-hydroxybutyrate dehydrogenase [Actinophytocola sp.]HYQ65131.1 3-hydroxybutyrate dehydrogenase [Actinophytocola sp.]